MNKDMYDVKRRFHTANGELSYCLEIFGNDLAKREGYVDLDGFDAIHFYLIHKFNWLPRDVRSMSHEDLRLVLHQDMEGWTLPPEA